MKRILYIVALLLVSFLGKAQTYDKIGEFTDSLQVGGVFEYQDSVIDLNDVTFHQFSSDSISWHKDYNSADVWVRFSNDNQNTWFTLPVQAIVDLSGIRDSIGLNTEHRINDQDTVIGNEYQVLYSNGSPGNVAIDNGNTISINVNDGDTSSTNEIQILSISNDTIYLTDGGFAVLPESSGLWVADANGINSNSEAVGVNTVATTTDEFKVISDKNFIAHLQQTASYKQGLKITMPSSSLSALSLYKNTTPGLFFYSEGFFDYLEQSTWPGNPAAGYGRLTPYDGSLYYTINGVSYNLTAAASGTSGVESLIAGSLIDVSSPTGTVTVNVDLYEASTASATTSNYVIWVDGSGAHKMLISDFLALGGGYTLPAATSSTRGGIRLANYTGLYTVGGDILALDISNLYTTSNYALSLDDLIALEDVSTGAQFRASLSEIQAIIGSGSSSDGYVGNVSLSGTDLVFTGYGSAFNGSVDLSGLGGGSMVYPAAGIAVSNGSGWNTSIANNSTNWNTAYSWGDHSVQGYLKGNQTITLSGDASGSGTTSIAVSLASNSVSSNELSSTGVVAGSYTNINATVDDDGRITSISNGDASAIYEGRVVTSNPTLTNSDNVVVLNDAAITEVYFPASSSNGQRFVIVNRTSSVVDSRNNGDTSDVLYRTTTGSDNIVFPSNKTTIVQRIGGVWYQINNF